MSEAFFLTDASKTELDRLILLFLKHDLVNKVIDEFSFNKTEVPA